MKTLYTTTVTATGGRNGKVQSDNGVLDMNIALPKALGGKNDESANPEQFFAAGYAACFESALQLVAQKSQVSLEHTAITAEVSIGANESGGFELAVKLFADIQGVSKEVAQELLEKAHEVCPYSHATRGNIDVTVALK